MKYIAEMANYKSITKEKQTLIKTQRTKALKSKEFKELLKLGLEVVNTKKQDDNMTIALSAKKLKLDRKAQYGGSAHKHEYLTYLITVNFDEPKSVKKPIGPHIVYHGYGAPARFLYKVIWDVHITTGRKWVQFPNATSYRHSSLINVFKDIKKHYLNKVALADSHVDNLIKLIKTTSFEDFDNIVNVYDKKYGNDFSNYIESIDLISNEKLENFIIEFFEKNVNFLFKADNFLKRFTSDETREKIEKDKGFLGKEFGFFQED